MLQMQQMFFIIIWLYLIEPQENPPRDEDDRVALTTSTAAFCPKQHYQIEKYGSFVSADTISLFWESPIGVLFNLAKTADRANICLMWFVEASHFVFPQLNSMLVWHPESLSSLPQSKWWLNLMGCNPDLQWHKELYLISNHGHMRSNSWLLWGSSAELVRVGSRSRTGKKKKKGSEKD